MRPRWRVGWAAVLAAEDEIIHVKGGDALVRSVQSRDGQRAVFQASHVPIQNRVLARGERRGLRIEIDPFDLLKIQVGDGTILASHLESLVKQGENSAFGFRAILEHDYIRPDADDGRQAQECWQYSLHRG